MNAIRTELNGKTAKEKVENGRKRKEASKKRAPVSFRVQRENIKSSRRNCLEWKWVAGWTVEKKSKELDWHALSFQDDRCEPPKERTCWEIETCRAADCESAAHWRLQGSGHRSLPLHRAGRDTIRFVSRISPGQREDRVSIQRLVFPSIKFSRLRRWRKIDLPRKIYETFPYSWKLKTARFSTIASYRRRYVT